MTLTEQEIQEGRQLSDGNVRRCTRAAKQNRARARWWRRTGWRICLAIALFVGFPFFFGFIGWMRRPIEQMGEYMAAVSATAVILLVVAYLVCLVVSIGAVLDPGREIGEGR